MKKYKIISFLFIIFAFSSLLVSCGEEAFTGTEIREDGTTVVYMLPVENIAEYTVIRGRNGSEAATAEASSLRTVISEAIGASLAIKTDEHKANFEILVGETEREESKKANAGLRYEEYVIKKEGNKIIIVGGSDKALKDACDIFKENFIDTEKGIVKVPMENGYTYKHEYALEGISVDGVDISEFYVYYDGKLIDTEEGILPEFIDKIRERIGVDLRLITQNMVNDRHYIVVNNTGLVAAEYSIEARDGNIYINGSYDSIETALKYFVGEFLEGKEKIELESGKSKYVMSLDKKDIYSKEQLMRVLTEAYNDKDVCIIGQQCEGGGAMIDETVAHFETTTGDKPGIIGLDLACYGVKLPTLSGEMQSKLICEIVDYCANGGILTISSHWANPADPSQEVRGKLGSFATVEEFEKAYREVYTPGTELNKAFVSELETNAIFLEGLKNNGVPVIWRPLHEMNANWFWYCITDSTNGTQTISSECFTDFWKYIYNYFDSEWGLDNLLWCFSPNTSSTPSTEAGSTIYCYPGDEYVDMVGCDWYTWGGLEIRNNNNYQNLVDHSGMIGALTEFGVDGPVKAAVSGEQSKVYNAERALNELKTLANEGYSFAYLLTWTPGSQAAIGVLGSDGSAFDFMDDEFTLGLTDVKAIFDRIK